MKKITDEQIKEIIKNKNKEILFIESKIIVKKNKKRRLVTMKCSCGKLFDCVLDKIYSNKNLLCSECARKAMQKNKNTKNRNKYLSRLGRAGYQLVNPSDRLISNNFVEVEDVENGYRGFTYPNAPKKILVFSLLHNRKNYIYNINNYAKNIGIESKAIRLIEDSRWSNQGVEFICECGELFETTDRAFKKGKFFCDKCTKRYSSNEVEFENYLKQEKIAYIHQFSINSLRDVNPLHFDFYLKDINILVEIDGEHHSKPVNFGGVLNSEQIEKRYEIYKKHDRMKEDYCKKFNIPLLRINYKDIKNKKYKDILYDFIQAHAKLTTLHK